jgi:hypothetical protein
MTFISHYIWVGASCWVLPKWWVEFCLPTPTTLLLLLLLLLLSSWCNEIFKNKYHNKFSICSTLDTISLVVHPFPINDFFVSKCVYVFFVFAWCLFACCSSAWLLALQFALNTLMQRNNNQPRICMWDHNVQSH